MGVCLSKCLSSESDFNYQLIKKEKRRLQAINEYHIVTNFISGYQNICPETLLIIITSYVGAIIRIFDLCIDEAVDDIKNVGISIQRGHHPIVHYRERMRKCSCHPIRYDEQITKIEKPIYFGCSNGFQPNRGIYKWCVKINKFPVSSSNDYEDRIGIISNCDYFKHDAFSKPQPHQDYDNYKILDPSEDELESIDDTSCKSIYLTLSKANDSCYKIQSNTHNDLITSTTDNLITSMLQNDPDYIYLITPTTLVNIDVSTPEFVINDVIAIYFDSDKQTIWFTKNKKQLCDPINIKDTIGVYKDQTYYPYINSVKEFTEYQLIPLEM